MHILADGDVDRALDLGELLSVIREAFERQGRGAVERPERPHFPVGRGLDPEQPDAPLGTGLAMPAYVHGADHYATKVVGVHGRNADRGLPTVNAAILLADAATGRPAALLAGNRITNARTGCIGGLAARELAAPPVTLALLGAGTQARWQARAVAAATEVGSIRVYSPSDSKVRCADDLESRLDVPATPAGTPREAVDGASVVVTATTATEPVFPGDALDPGAVVVAVGAYTADMRELDATTMERAARIFTDVPDEAAETGDVLAAGLGADDLHPFADLFLGGAGRGADDEVIVVESVGSAVLDAAAAEHVLDVAAERGLGTVLEL